MTEPPVWELIAEGHRDWTERLEIAGGWLIRTVWRRVMGVGQPELDGSAIVFVPMSDAEKMGEKLKLAAQELKRLEHAQEAEVDTQPEDDVGETGGEPEQIRITRPDHGQGRRRAGER